MTKSTGNDQSHFGENFIPNCATSNIVNDRIEAGRSS